MKFEIVDLQELSGIKSKIYSVIVLDNENDQTLYDLFIEEFIDDYLEEIQDIQDALRTYGHYTGIRGYRIIEHEGETLGDGIVAICNTPKKLFRLYAILYGDHVAIIGGGGAKPGAGDLRNFEGPRNANFLIRKIKKTLDAAEECGDLVVKNRGIESKTKFIYNTKDYE